MCGAHVFALPYISFEECCSKTHCIVWPLLKQHQRFPRSCEKYRLSELSPDLKNQNLHFRSAGDSSLRSTSQRASYRFSGSICHQESMLAWWHAEQHPRDFQSVTANSVFFPISQHGPFGLRWTSTGRLLSDNTFQGGLGGGVGRSRCVTVEEGSLREKDEVLVWSQVNG